jgi:hypothetical protein
MGHLYQQASIGRSRNRATAEAIVADVIPPHSMLAVLVSNQYCLVFRTNRWDLDLQKILYSTLSTDLQRLFGLSIDLLQPMQALEHSFLDVEPLFQQVSEDDQIRF